MMRFSEARRRDVVATGDAENVGRVDAFVVDPESRRVTALRLDKVSGDARYVSYGDLASFGRDVVTVPDASVLREAADDRERQATKRSAVLGKRILTDAGREVGEVEDVEFDPATGEVTALLTSREEIAGERLRGIGSYAVVVRRPSR